jgi:cysteine desulfurase
MENKRIYLDYAAATPVDDEVLRVMNMSNHNFANPSAQYASARQSRLILEKARKESAMFLQSNFEEIIFTSGATESNNLAVLGIASVFGEGRIISIQTEHSSVLGPLQKLADIGFEVVYCPVDSSGQVVLSELKKLLTKKTLLVTISYANSEIGTIQPLTKISQIIKAFNAENGSDIKLHSDASAAVLCLACDVARLGVDSLTIGGAKIYGPHGVGLLYVKRGLSIDPIQFGGGQQLGLRPGTEPVSLAAGMARALSIASKSRNANKQHFQSLKTKFIELLEKSNLEFKLNSPKNGIANIVNLSIVGQSGEDLVARLDAVGVEVATGAACEVNNEEPSKVLLAIGLSKTEAQASLRVSFGKSTTVDDLEMLVDALSDIIQSR